MTREQIKEATQRGTAWGEQEAELMRESIEDGHRATWANWTMGAYCGELPHAQPTLLAKLAVWQGRTEEQEAERSAYENILDRAAKVAYDAAEIKAAVRWYLQAAR